jgi:hypothetical protein
MSSQRPSSAHPARLLAGLAACLSLVLVGGPVAGAQAAPPANDDFADAVAVSLPDHATGTIDEATLEPGEPGTEGEVFTRSVWYAYTPATQQRVRVETCGSTFSARATVYTGASVDHVTEVARTNGGCDGGGRGYFTAAAGTTYHIAVTGYIDEEGEVSLTLAVPSPPANDDFADAEDVSLPGNATGAIDDATLETGEPDSSEEGLTVSVWYRYTAATSGRVKLDSCASTFYAQTAVYTGAAVDSLTRVARSEDTCDGGGLTYFTASAGTTYHLAVTSLVGRSGHVALAVTVPQPPPNDDFANARPVAMPEQLVGTNVDATLESGEPDPFADGTGHSVWYRLTMHTTQPVGIDTCGSDMDTVLGVYTGSSVGGLTEIGLDDDSCDSDSGSIVDFVSSPGTTYYIMVRGYGSSMGEFTLLAGSAHASTSPPPPPPPLPVPPCPLPGSPAGAVGYAGTHSGGGTMCLTVLPTFGGVASLHVADAPGDICRFRLAIDRFAPSLLVANRAFSTAQDALSGSFSSDRGAEGTFQLSRTVSDGETCTSPVLSWTASTSATPPWVAAQGASPPPPPPPADRTPPGLRLSGAAVQHALRTNHLVVVARCRGEACVAKATASIAGVKLGSRDTAIRAGRSHALTLVLSTRARRALRASLRSHHRVRARVLVVARDAAGNRASGRRAVTITR